MTVLDVVVWLIPIGLTEDLGMTGSNAHRYNIALFVFFVPYVLFEVPSNLVLKKLKPSTWLSLIMILWGELCRLLLSASHSNAYQASRQLEWDSLPILEV